jgi:hypothetical protein
VRQHGITEDGGEGIRRDGMHDTNPSGAEANRAGAGANRAGAEARLGRGNNKLALRFD